MVSKFFWTLVASVNRRDDSPGYELLWRRGLSSVEPMLCRGAMFVGICTKNSKNSTQKSGNKRSALFFFS